MDKKDNTYVCVICGEEHTGYPNNAAPVDDGPCCDKCNIEKVIPARLKKIGIA